LIPPAPLLVGTGNGARVTWTRVVTARPHSREETVMNTTRPLSRIARSGAAALTTLTLSIALTACGSQDDEPAETAPAASAGESLLVEDPWIRATEESKDATMTAAFMVLDNDGSEE